MSSQIKYPLVLTDEETNRIQEILGEAGKRATAMRNMFDQTTEGMMLFMLALLALKIEYPKCFERLDRATTMIMEWVAAGEPEEPNEVAKRLKKRMGIDE
jgi:nitrate reductase assembly molybdenum cofactor insertion protein NarJ